MSEVKRRKKEEKTIRQVGKQENEGRETDEARHQLVSSGGQQWLTSEFLEVVEKQ